MTRSVSIKFPPLIVLRRTAEPKVLSSLSTYGFSVTVGMINPLFVGTLSTASVASESD